MFSSLKETAIKDYILKIDFKNDDWSINRIREDMRRFLGEEPGLDIFYKKDIMLNEVTGKAHEIKSIDKIQIVFTDTDDKFKKLEFIIDKI